MAFLIRSIALTADGREIVREQEIAKDTISIGRAAENDIHLPDLAVEQRHARIAPADGRRLRIESSGTLGFAVDGRAARSALIDPREGVELAFGSYRLAVSQEAGGPVAVTIRQTQGRSGNWQELVRGFSLASALPGKRANAWIAVAAIVILFLAVPITTHLARTKVEPQIAGKGQVLMDASWSPGALSLAHHGLEDNCEACHVKPFESVRDAACLTCHEDTGDHAAQQRLDTARGWPGLGESIQRVFAYTFGKPGPGACVECHTEHEGAAPMLPASQQLCVDCHASLDRRLTETTLGNAADFGKAHPPFKAQIFTAPRQKAPEFVELASQPREWNGLRFPHKLHLDPRGGVARMAGTLSAEKGYSESLVCGDCHHPTKDRSGFQPIVMERDCESCHSLVYDRVGTTLRKLQHGDVAQLQADLAAMDRTPHRPVVTHRRRAGQSSPGGLAYPDFGLSTRNYVAINRAFARDGVCGACHIPTVTNGRADLMPVNLPRSFLPRARFDHAAHTQETCASCHRAATSERASDLLLPDIEQCRTCHGGENARSAEVPSGCAMCHSYHPHESPPEPVRGQRQRVGLGLALSMEQEQ